MGLRVAIDLVSIDAVEASTRIHSAHYVRRVFTSRELRDCRTPDRAPDPRRLAERFAAEEAALKVLGVRDESVPWQSIDVRNDRFGIPAIELTGAAERLALQHGVMELKLGFTHEGLLARRSSPPRCVTNLEP